MNGKFLRIPALLLALAAVAGCSEELAERSKGETTLLLSASKSEIILDERNFDTPELLFEWTSGSNYGTGNAIDYTLEIALSEADYTDGMKIEAGRRVYSQAFTAGELNDLVYGSFEAQPGEAAACKARITARVAGDSRTQQAEVRFSVTPYRPVTETLFLIGDATPTGWSVDAPEALTRTKPGRFTWTGNLKKGELKFITARGTFLPSYNRDATAENATTLCYRDSDDQPDEKFQIAEEGGYTLTVDLLDLTLGIEPADADTPPFGQIYFVSEANEWSFRPMTQDPVDPFVFRYGAEIGNGQFKFGTTEGSWENMYKTDTDNADYTHPTVCFVAGFDPDNKWLLHAEREGLPYKIALDITPGKESMHMEEFSPYGQLWMVGDATPNGWSLDSATPLQRGADDYTFTWSGKLADGELKFTCDRDNSWNGAWFMASADGKELASGSETICFVDKRLPEQSATDRKWRVAAGNYTLVLNQLTETLTVTKN